MQLAKPSPPCIRVNRRHFLPHVLGRRPNNRYGLRSTTLLPAHHNTYLPITTFYTTYHIYSFYMALQCLHNIPQNRHFHHTLQLERWTFGTELGWHFWMGHTPPAPHGQVPGLPVPDAEPDSYTTAGNGRSSTLNICTFWWTDIPAGHNGEHFSLTRWNRRQTAGEPDVLANRAADKPDYCTPLPFVGPTPVYSPSIFPFYTVVATVVGR